MVLGFVSLLVAAWLVEFGLEVEVEASTTGSAGSSAVFSIDGFIDPKLAHPVTNKARNTLREN